MSSLDNVEDSVRMLLKIVQRMLEESVEMFEGDSNSKLVATLIAFHHLNKFHISWLWRLKIQYKLNRGGFLHDLESF